MATKLAVCGGFRCKRIFEVKGRGTPTIYICSTCEQKINEGIKMTLHERTGRPIGNFNILDKGIVNG
jgi:hypothetical protein